MTAILGISAFYHDSAAALLRDGDIVAAAQEERFTRRKHDERFPVHAIQYCLDAAQLTADDIEYVGFYDKPLLKFDRLLETYLAFAPRGWRSFVTAMPDWLHRKLHVPRAIHRGLGGGRRHRPIYTAHHEAHAASAFLPSPFREAAIVTVDGVGEWATTTWGIGRDNTIALKQSVRFPHSLGLLYSAFTYFCGFHVNSDEYKLMGLAPYGKPRYRQRILNHLIDVKADGSFRMDMDFFDYCHGLRMTSTNFARLFDGPPCAAGTPPTEREMDLAASVQSVLESILLRIVRHVHQRTKLPNLCMAGGVALNCVANGRILEEGPFAHLWVQPAAGDAGGALGAAWFIWHQLLDKPRTPASNDGQHGSLLGPHYTSAEVRCCLDGHNVTYQEPQTFLAVDADQHARPCNAAATSIQSAATTTAYTVIEDESQLCSIVAQYLAQGLIVGWFQGRMEFGPRALGNRSILADPRNPQMPRILNDTVKHRESFRPFGPAVLQDRAGDYFQLGRSEQYPYMTITLPVHQQQRRAVAGQPSDRVCQLAQYRSSIPAVTHVDYSARVQTVDRQRNPRFHRLLEAFSAVTDCPVLVNTSFNVRGEPIVCAPADAVRCFQSTGLDVLVMEDCVVRNRRGAAGN